MLGKFGQQRSGKHQRPTQFASRIEPAERQRLTKNGRHTIWPGEQTTPTLIERLRESIDIVCNLAIDFAPPSQFRLLRTKIST